jgi:hypothetical protein
MASKALITAFTLSLLFTGLAAPTCRAFGPRCALLQSAVKAASLGAELPGKDGGRVVSQQKDKDENRVQKKPVKVDTAPKVDGPMAVFADVENGWKKKKINLILDHFGRGKVTISIDGTGPSGGQFSKNQSYYLLKDLFKYTITRKFEFVQYRKPNKKGNTTFAVAERHYQKRDDGRLFKDKIYVSLHLERPRDDKTASGQWVIDEIKSIR